MQNHKAREDYKKIDILKGLQVRAELNRLADPSPAMATLLMMEDDNNQMADVETTATSSKSISELFAKI